MSSTENSAKHPSYKRWVFFFLVVALLAHGGGFYFFNFRFDEPDQISPQRGFVFYQPDSLPLESDELKARAYLFDSEPIFLPTTRNFSGPIKTDASIWEPEVELAAGFPPDIRWSDSLLIMEPRPEGSFGDPLQLLESVSRDFVSEFGVEAVDASIEIDSGLFVEARDSEGSAVLKTFIQLDDGDEVDFPLNPAEFSILHTDLGVAGEPLLIWSSGSVSTDNYLRRFILDKVHPKLLGNSGYFHLKIGL